MSNSVRPHRWQPTRLLRSQDSPGKNTGVGCHFVLQCMKVKVKLPSHVLLLATPWTAAYQAPPSKGFSRQEYCSCVPLPSPGVHAQFEQILDKRCKKTKTPNCYFWRAWNKVRVSGEKVEYCTYPLHTTPPKGWANHLSHSSGLTTGHTPVLVAQSCPTLCDPRVLYPARLLCP